MLSLIKPIVPNMYYGFGTKPDMNILMWSIFLLFAGISAYFLSNYSAVRFKSNRKKTAAVFIISSVIITALLICFFGFTAITIKGIILSLILILSSYQDIRVRECDDYLHLMVLIAAFIGTEMSSLAGMFISAGIVFAIMTGTVFLTRSKIGGADIKLSAACSFMLGLRRGLAGLVFGLMLAVIINLIKQRKNKKAGFPMIPYLAAGFMAAYFI